MANTPKPRDLYERLDRLGLDWLCDQLIDGRSVRSVARELDASAVAILKWIDREPGRMRAYRMACEARADAMVDDMIDLADEPVPVGPDGRMDAAAVNDKRLRIDTRKWIASKFRPSMYGDRVEVAGSFKAEEVPPDEILKKIVGILSAHGLRVVPDEEPSLESGGSTPRLGQVESA